MEKVLTIAGSDCSGGAGIQADLKTFCAHQVYGMSVISALTAQNTLGVQDILNIDASFVESQIKSVFDDITPSSVKIGMVSSKDIAKSIAKMLTYYDAKNIVYDPVMVSTSGHNLLDKDAINTIVKYLLPIADVITPNLFEAQILANMSISNEQEMINAAQKISKLTKAAILIKGGHFENTCNDLLFENNKATWINGTYFENPNTHGTGCTLSSAIASNLAKNNSTLKSCQLAKEYVQGAISEKFDIGKGNGPLNHLYKMK